MPPARDQQAPAPRANAGSLEAYFRDNAGAVTEDVLAERARAAGHSDTAIAAALEEARALPASAGGRAIRAILISYGVTFALLSLGMLVNSSPNRGEFMPEGAGGVTLLGIALGASLVASLIWIASRRTFWSILAVLAILAGVGNLSSGPLWAIVVVGGAVGVLWLVWRKGSRDVGTRTDIAVLLVVPLLLLVGVAGTCLASGLPLPVAGR